MILKFFFFNESFILIMFTNKNFVMERILTKILILKSATKSSWAIWPS